MKEKEQFFQYIDRIGDNKQSSFIDQFFMCANLQKYFVYCKINDRRQSEKGLYPLGKIGPPMAPCVCCSNNAAGTDQYSKDVQGKLNVVFVARVTKMFGNEGKVRKIKKTE